MLNKRQREYLKFTLDEEKKTLRELEKIYKDALETINEKIAVLIARRDVENINSIFYQLGYQKALKSQINAILDNLNSNQYEKIQDYLLECYNNGFIGTMYDLHGQEIPLVLPIDQEQVLNALTIDSKISTSLYEKLGENVSELKKKIRQEISRGIASAMSYADIARNLSNVSKTGLSNAFRIARTEGHRIQNQSAFDAMNKAKEKGAEVVKQWDATLDGRTRKTHRELDGKIVEVDEPFIFNGHKAMYPGGFGVASLDINCRCAVLTRAKWALDEEELRTLEEKASYFGLDKTKDFNDFKEKYLKSVDKVVLSNSRISVDSKIIIPNAKIDSYYLKPGTTHHHEFADVGYSIFKSDILKSDLINGLKENDIIETKIDNFGKTRIIVNMHLGVTKKKPFKTIWVYEVDIDSYRNISAYRISEKKKV